MATIGIRYEWPTQDSLTIRIDVDNDYPDCLNQASGQAVRAMRDAIAVLTELEAEVTPDG